MAHLPAKKNGSPPALSQQEEEIAWLVAEGWTPAAIARRLAPEDKRLRQKIRKKIRDSLYRSAALQEDTAKKIKAVALIGAGQTLKAVQERVNETGRPDGAKLLFEMSGVHAPRVEHEHSGDVTLTLNLPRPERKQVESESEVIDAEVVDD